MAPSTGATRAPFPAASKTTSAIVSSVTTIVTSLSFTDKILLTISQAGRVNHWVHVPLARGTASEMLALSQPPSYSGEGPDSSLLPDNQLTATTVLGGTKEEFDILGQTVATTVASAMLMRNGEEQRTLVVGLGLANAELDKSAFDDLIGACLDVI